MSRRGIALTVAPMLLAGLLSGCVPDPAPAPPPSPATSDASTPSGTGASSNSSTSGSASSSPSSAAPSTLAAPSTSPGTPASAPGTRTAKISTSGDLLWNSTLFEAARTADGFDFRPQLEGLRVALARADLAICHQEVPVAQAGGPYASYPTFRVPAETVDAVADVGFDLCTTASNHTMDAGWDGLVRTRAALEQAGVGVVGSYATAAQAEMSHIFTTDQGVKVAIVSQTYGLNGIPHAEGREWSVDFLDPDKAIADARRVRAAGADIVVFHMHAGTEYTIEPNPDQRYMAARVTGSGEFDLVIGQHAHVVQPIEKVNGVWTVYSTGNLMAGMPAKDFHEIREGMIVDISFREKPSGGFEVSGVEWSPTLITLPEQEADGIPRVRVVPDALADAPEHLRRLMKASADRTRGILAPTAPAGLVERTAPLR